MVYTTYIIHVPATATATAEAMNDGLLFERSVSCGRSALRSSLLRALQRTVMVGVATPITAVWSAFRTKCVLQCKSSAFRSATCAVEGRGSLPCVTDTRRMVCLCIDGIDSISSGLSASPSESSHGHPYGFAWALLVRLPSYVWTMG